MAVEDNNGYYYKYHVIPEFPSTTILMMFMILSTLTIVLAKKRTKWRAIGVQTKRLLRSL